MKYSLVELELENLLKIIASYSKSNLVQQKILEIRPTFSLEKISVNHALLGQLNLLIDLGIKLPEVFFANLNEIFTKLEIFENYLGVQELISVKNFLENIKDLADKILEIELNNPQIQSRALSQIREKLIFTREIYETLQKSIEEPEFITNNATPELSEIRRRIQFEENSLKTRLENILVKLSKEEVLQENFYTIRNNRFVVPVKAEAKRKVPGIVHDYSDTEKTAFIEPSHLIESGNTLAELYAEEKNVCRKILKLLTEKIREKLPGLLLANNNLILYEFARAIATWGNQFNCILPRFGQSLCLQNARHPIIESKFLQSKNKIIPLDIFVDLQKIKTIAITGSNAGGKTVALKTVGLLSIMAQSGLPVPCDESSRFVIFQNILADIGDSQSINHNLSTFSAHLAKVKDFLAISEKEKSSLILIDEIGSGTDPLEGGSLACAILEKFSQIAALTIATTHLGTVKSYVAENSKMLNASMLFNTNTFSPEFKLHLGRPGASHAISIAKKMELPADVIQNAEKMLDSDQLRLESILSTLEEDQRNFYSDLEKLKKDKTETEKAKKELNEQLNLLKKERKKIMHDAYQEAATMLKNTQKEMRRIVKVAAENQGEAIQKIHEKEEIIVEQIKQTQAKPDEPLNIKKIKIGDMVWVEKLQIDGEIISEVKNGKVKLRIDGVTFEIATNQLGKPKNKNSTKKPSHETITISSRPIATNAVTKINLVGLRIHQAMNQLEYAIDQAHLAKLHELTIIHGFGTGTLRNSIQEYLRRMNFSFHDGEHEKGESGCTIVTF